MPGHRKQSLEILRLSCRLTLDRLPRALMGLAPEEQRLANHRGNHRQLERLGDEERRLRPLSGQEALWIGSDKDHRHFQRAQKFVDSVETRAAIGELNIG